MINMIDDLIPSFARTILNMCMCKSGFLFLLQTTMLENREFLLQDSPSGLCKEKYAIYMYIYGYLFTSLTCTALILLAPIRNRLDAMMLFYQNSDIYIKYSELILVQFHEQSLAKFLGYLFSEKNT